jgi:hypothetical protein
VLIVRADEDADGSPEDAAADALAAAA